MNNQRWSSSGIPAFAWRRCAIIAIASALGAGPALAQETVVIGGGGQPAVEVNLDVLRTLDGSGTQRVLRFPGEAVDQSFVLKPPGGATAEQASTVRRPALRPPAPSVAARPTAPQPAVRAPSPTPATVTPPAAPQRPQQVTTAPAAPSPQSTAAAPPPPPPAAVAPRSDSLESRRITPTTTPRQESTAPREQTAALTAPNLPAEGQALRVLFDGSRTQLDSAAEEQLQQLATALNANEQRVQLKAFASGSSDRPSAARRESLSRALAVRSFLIENGVRSTRIDVRALGQPNDGGPNDRVDVILLTQ